MRYVLGIDDAGRGPIIGPMVIGGVLIKKEDNDRLKALDVKDSKMILPKKREILSKEIKAFVPRSKTLQISPLEIDSREENGLNLNDLEALKMAEVINELTKGISEVDVIVDCPSTNPIAWKHTLLKYIEVLDGKRFVIEHKADEKYLSCAAASILAKVERDSEIHKIQKMLKVDFGSGYPADPTTREFLEESGHKYLKYNIIRKTWQTWKNLETKKSQKKLF